jgi:hypothetical protein
VLGHTGVLDQGDHGIAATKGESPDLEKGEKQSKKLLRFLHGLSFLQNIICKLKYYITFYKNMQPPPRKMKKDFRERKGPIARSAVGPYGFW